MAIDMPDRLPTAKEREAYQAKVKAELDKLNARIDEYKAKAAAAKADAEINYHSIVEELSAQRDALSSKWEEMSTASEAAWQELQKGFDNAWSDLTSAFEKAAKHFDAQND